MPLSCRPVSLRPNGLARPREVRRRPPPKLTRAHGCGDRCERSLPRPATGRRPGRFRPRRPGRARSGLAGSSPATARRRLGRAPGFATLAAIILEQQVSLASGAAALARLGAAAGAIEPAAIVALGEEGARAAGLTRQKARYVVGLADAALDGRFDPGAIEAADDDDARAALTSLLGVGRWTADIYLLMALGRPDIWPDGDLALAAAMRRESTSPPSRMRPASAPSPSRGNLAGRRGAPPVARVPRRRALIPDARSTCPASPGMLRAFGVRRHPIGESVTVIA